MMRLRSRENYIEAITNTLSNHNGAMKFSMIANETSETLNLKQEELRKVRPNGYRTTNQHRSNVSSILYYMRIKGLIVVSGDGRQRKYSLSNQPTHSEIEQLAFKKYAGRGYVNGNAEQDWLEAEKELRKRK